MFSTLKGGFLVAVQFPMYKERQNRRRGCGTNNFAQTHTGEH